MLNNAFFACRYSPQDKIYADQHHQEQSRTGIMGHRKQKRQAKVDIANAQQYLQDEYAGKYTA